MIRGAPWLLFFVIDARGLSRFILRVQRKAKPKNPDLRIFILAGGKSRRMGRDKALLLLGGRTFLEQIQRTAAALQSPVEVITDDLVPHCGPLGGIHSAFHRFQFGSALFLSCDMPLVTVDFLAELLREFRKDRSAISTVLRGQSGMPFVLPRAGGRVVDLQLRRKHFSLQDLFKTLKARKFSPKPVQRSQFVNVNTPADFREAQRLWADGQSHDAVLEVRNLNIRRGRTQLVTSFSWKVARREHWVILGPNGCGKTSLFAALLGYLTPTAGDIFLLGEEYGDSDWPELRQKIGLVSSSVRQMMAEHEPAWIAVASGRYAMIDFWGTPKRGDRLEAMRILREMEAEYLADRPWAVLSQGERQRILIGRALMSRPALLILDEPCAGLDPAAREHFLDFLDRLGRRKNAPSLVLVTHHVEEIMPVFTHALIMKGGAKLAEGLVRQALTASNLSAAFETPIRLKKRDGRYSLRVQSNPQVII